MKKNIILLSIGSAALIGLKLQIMGGINYFKTHDQVVIDLTRLI